MSGANISFRSNPPPRVGDSYTPREQEPVEESNSEEPISQVVIGRRDEYPSAPISLNFYSPSPPPEHPEIVPETVKTPEPLEKEKGAPTVPDYVMFAAGLGCMVAGLIGGPLAIGSNQNLGIGLFCLIALGACLQFSLFRKLC
jgi:hypothetical protein